MDHRNIFKNAESRAWMEVALTECHGSTKDGFVKGWREGVG